MEVDAGLVPGGGPIARLPRLIERADIDGFVDALATRIAPFDKQAIVDTKRFANVPGLPPDVEIAPEWQALMAAVGQPATQQRSNRLMERGFTNRASTSRHPTIVTPRLLTG